jgi:hypothetical protein
MQKKANCDERTAQTHRYVLSPFLFRFFVLFGRLRVLRMGDALHDVPGRSGGRSNVAFGAFYRADVSRPFISFRVTAKRTGTQEVGRWIGLEKKS